MYRRIYEYLKILCVYETQCYNERQTVFKYSRGESSINVFYFPDSADGRKRIEGTDSMLILNEKFNKINFRPEILSS